jgi:hypothetical protein
VTVADNAITDECSAVTPWRLALENVAARRAGTPLIHATSANDCRHNVRAAADVGFTPLASLA